MSNKLEILGVNIDRLVRMAINESLPKDERVAQDKKTKELEDFKAPEKTNEAEEVDEAEDDDGSSKKVKAEDIVSLFNVMRSGKSLKDAQVRKNFQAYFDSLNGSERVALFAFSKAIADIIAGENTEQEAADEPQPDDYGVEISKDDGPKKKVKKKKSVEKTETGDDSAPIVVGESADKSRELKIMRRLK